MRQVLTASGIGAAEVSAVDDGDLAHIGDGLAFEDVDQGFDSLVTHVVGILGNGALQDVVAAEDHAGELVGAIIAEDEDLASQSGLLDGLGCADGAAFVASPDDLDFGVGGQHVGGGGQGSVLSVGADWWQLRCTSCRRPSSQQ